MLISLLIFAVVVYCVYLIINFIPFPEPLKTIVWIIFGVIVLIQLLGMFHTGFSIPRLP